MRRLDEVLGSAVDAKEILRAARALRVLRSWPDIVGPHLAERSHPDRYERGTVYVAVQGSAWAQELRMVQERLLERLNEAAQEPGLFQTVRFGVRPLPEPEEPDDGPERAKRYRASLQGLSIREIVERRFGKREP